ncbi:MAG: nucleoside triphosphate pyrophosphohydrolase [SAR86 cluster bacterium]|uniref:Nucleoside triphosphate pyrophosphohydrolase n=1 Tax=SAR86 cluster bacterium TaxID=2030880 RepID=A0A2A5AZ55_9GAMM|nr:MAG: nucleoside triphosphate pyrophosphohydrolase [SAR86 cluster bacterium]
MSAIEKLTALMSMLRDKEFGCPWDIEQTISSLVPYTLEEVYEVVDAIENNDMVELEDELGDLLLQIVFYGQLAKEQGRFSFEDIAESINNKLIRRHPHVFPGGDVRQFGIKQDISPDQVVVNWEKIKEEEREEKKRKGGIQALKAQASLLDDVPRSLPAMERARKLQNRAAQAGFDWQDIAPVLDKLKEEIAEFEQALKDKDAEQMSNELGDIMFTAVNMARHCSIEPEIALRSCNKRFENRVRWIETNLQSQGRIFRDTKLQELELLWEKAKESGL